MTLKRAGCKKKYACIRISITLVNKKNVCSLVCSFSVQLKNATSTDPRLEEAVVELQQLGGRDADVHHGQEDPALVQAQLTAALLQVTQDERCTHATA